MDKRVQTVINMMEGSFHRDLSFNRMAYSIHLSRSRFFHLFKNETGTTPSRHLKSIRMEQAKRLLETSFLSVKEIMVRVGLRDESHFVRDFQKIYGLSPSEYRSTFASMNC